MLDEVAEVLKEIGDRGSSGRGPHRQRADSGELAKRFPTNWELSTARAISVVRYLQEVAGVDPVRLSAAGYGPYRPAVPNDSAENRARNRRIEMKLVPLESPLVGGQDEAGTEAPSEASDTSDTEQEAELPAEQPAEDQGAPQPASGTSTP